MPGYVSLTQPTKPVSVYNLHCLQSLLLAFGRFRLRHSSNLCRDAEQTFVNPNGPLFLR